MSAPPASLGVGWLDNRLTHVAAGDATLLPPLVHHVAYSAPDSVPPALASGVGTQSMSDLSPCLDNMLRSDAVQEPTVIDDMRCTDLFQDSMPGIEPLPELFILDGHEPEPWTPVAPAEAHEAGNGCPSGVSWRQDSGFIDVSVISDKLGPAARSTAGTDSTLPPPAEASSPAKRQRRQTARNGAGVRRQKPLEKPKSDVQGVTWTNWKTWRVVVKGPNNPRDRAVIVRLSEHGGDIERARLAAEDIAAQILAGTYVFPSKRRAEYTSEVSGVRWIATGKTWLVKVDGPNNPESRTIYVSSAKHGNDVDLARAAAEDIARQIQAGTYVFPLKRRAEHTSAVSGVCWSGKQKRWEIRFKDPHFSKHRKVSVYISQHGNSIEQARLAAEDIARQIRAGTYVLPPKRCAKYTSAVSGVTWVKEQKRWLVKAKNPNDPKIQYASVSAKDHQDDVERVREEAENLAKRIRAGDYVPKRKPRKQAG